LDPLPKVCIVVPTFNERENIEPLVLAISAVGSGLDVLFVDDLSPDGTADEVRRAAAGRANVHLIVREGKRGLGSAHVDGFRHAIESLGSDVLVEMDADLQHPPGKIPDLLAELARGYDVVVASRKIEGGGTTGWPLWRRAVSRGANLLARFVLGLEVKDCTSGFRALNRRSAEALVGARLPDSGYSFQVASLIYLKKMGMKMAEVPFTFQTRKAGKSKMGMTEILRFFVSVLKLRVIGS
jgi:dolichol-phosphate mannosyltransferase